jgi:hypothetical protein
MDLIGLHDDTEIIVPLNDTIDTGATVQIHKGLFALHSCIFVHCIC